MSNPTPTAAEVQATLRRISELLRDADHLEPGSRQALAQVIEELTGHLGEGGVTAAQMEHLRESAAQLLAALRRPQDAGATQAARERLHEARSALEPQSMFLAGIMRRLLEALAALGI